MLFFHFQNSSNDTYWNPWWAGFGPPAICLTPLLYTFPQEWINTQASDEIRSVYQVMVVDTGRPWLGTVFWTPPPYPHPLTRPPAPHCSPSFRPHPSLCFLLTNSQCWHGNRATVLLTPICTPRPDCPSVPTPLFQLSGSGPLITSAITSAKKKIRIWNTSIYFKKNWEISNIQILDFFYFIYFDRTKVNQAVHGCQSLH